MTDVQIMDGGSSKKAIWFARLTINDAIAINDIRIIWLEKQGHPLIAMPCRRATRRCPDCWAKCDHAANYCAKCARPLDRWQPEPNEKRFHDVAFPCNHEARAIIDAAVLDAWRRFVGAVDIGVNDAC